MANDIGTDFADKEMLLIDPDWIENVQSRFQVERRLIGYGYTAATLNSINTDAPINLELNYPITNHEDHNSISFVSSLETHLNSVFDLELVFIPPIPRNTNLGKATFLKGISNLLGEETMINSTYHIIVDNLAIWS